MDHSNDNGLQPEAEISSASRNNGTHGLSSVIRTRLQCPICCTVHDYDHHIYATYFQRRQSLWCHDCCRFRPQRFWEILENDELPDNTGGWISIDDYNSDIERLWEYYVNFELAGFETNLTEEVIWKYLLMGDRTKSRNKDEGCEICGVCMKKLIEEEEFIRLDCGHDYHFNCIRQWLLPKNSCPRCFCTVIPPDFVYDFNILFQLD